MSVLDEAAGVCRAYFMDDSIDRHYLRQNTKNREVVKVRYFAMAYIRACDPNRYSYPMIAHMVGRKDHTTALHGIRHAHRIWGQQTFVRLAFQRLSRRNANSEREIPQAIHIRATSGEILARGAELMRAELAATKIFTNGQGWRDAA